MPGLTTMLISWNSPAASSGFSEGVAPAEISKAHRVPSYMLQRMVATEEPDTKRAHWYRAPRDPKQNFGNVRNLRRSSKGTLLAYVVLRTSGLLDDSRQQR